MKKTQLARIRAALEAGESLTPLAALNRFGCFRLADVVYKLKKTGMVINTELIDVVGAHGTASVARYRLDKGAPGPCPNGGARPAGEGPAARACPECAGNPLLKALEDINKLPPFHPRCATPGIDAPGPAPASVHLCATCKLQFATCPAKRLRWGIDVNPAARGAAADCVVECDAYAPDRKPGAPVAVEHLPGGTMEGATFKGIRLDSLAENLAWILQELKDQDKAFSLGEKDHPHLICHGVVERLENMLAGKL
jgi:hypothetical protein